MTENEEEKEKKKIKELEEKVKKLEKEVKAGKEEKEETEEEEEETGIAEEVIGGFFPGLGKMVKGLKKSEVFKERFEEVDREIEERMKEGGGGGGREISRGRYSIGKRPGPHVEADYSVRTLVGEKHEPSFRGREEVQKRREREKRVKEIRVDKEAVKEKEPLIDIMDEKDYIMVIAEMPGVEEKDIKTEFGIGDGGNKLIISTEGKGEGKREYYKEIDLPSEVKGEIKRMYKHGVLEVRLEKEGEKK